LVGTWLELEAQWDCIRSEPKLLEFKVRELAELQGVSDIYFRGWVCRTKVSEGSTMRRVNMTYLMQPWSMNQLLLVSEMYSGGFQSPHRCRQQRQYFCSLPNRIPRLVRRLYQSLWGKQVSQSDCIVELWGTYTYPAAKLWADSCAYRSEQSHNQCLASSESAIGRTLFHGKKCRAASFSGHGKSLLRLVPDYNLSARSFYLPDRSFCPNRRKADRKWYTSNWKKRLRTHKRGWLRANYFCRRIPTKSCLRCNKPKAARCGQTCLRTSLDVW